MAVTSQGTSIEQVGVCKKRSCLILHEAVLVSAKKNAVGKLIEETYKIRNPTGSAARAVMHGLLDVATLGLWEVAGITIEGTLGKKEFYNITVSYQED